MAQFISLRKSGQETVWRLLEAAKQDAPRMALQGRHFCELRAENTPATLEDRLSLAAAIADQGAGTLTVQPHEWRQDVESLSLQLPLYEQYADALLVQGLSGSALTVLTANSKKPVYNVSDAMNNPAAALADIALMRRTVEDLSTLRVAWVGGLNGLAYSLIEAALFVPFEFFIALPEWCEPDHDSLDLALRAGARIFMTREPHLALDEAHFVYAGTGPTAAAGAPLGPAFRITQEYMALARPEARLLTAETLSPICRADDGLLEAAVPLWEERLKLRRKMQSLVLQYLFSD